MASSVSLPSATSLFIDIDGYDINQLISSVEAAVERQDQLSDEVSYPTDSKLHLHTLTLESTLTPPPPLLPERALHQDRDLQSNPRFERLEHLRAFLRKRIPAYEPIQIISPTPGLIHIPSNIPNNKSRWRKPPTATVSLPNVSKNRPIVTIPNILAPRAHDWIAANTTWDMQNWLHTALSLDPDEPKTRKGEYRGPEIDGKAHRRFSLHTGLQLCWIPDGEGDGAGMDIKFLITVHVIVDFHQLFEKLPEIGDSMQGFILSSLMPSRHLGSDIYDTSSESQARASALRRLYEIMQPAPDLSFTFNAKQLQPPEMMTTLYPFQTRTLALLMKRERAAMFDGRLGDESRKPMDPDGFWEAFDLGPLGRIAYRRLTGDLVRLGLSHLADQDAKGKGRARDVDLYGCLNGERESLPIIVDLSIVTGTMLCEEMGLGKTVEAIALVLLHRHPLSTSRYFELPVQPLPVKERNSNKKSVTVPVIDLQRSEDYQDDAWAKEEKKAFEGASIWEEDAMLHIQEVATTLIVTPPSLLRQWVSEMRTHAPSMRICVYDGWKSLQNGIRYHGAINNKTQDAKRKRKNAKERDHMVKKYTRGGSGQKVAVAVKVETAKNESGDEAESDQDEGPSSKPDRSLLQITQDRFLDYIRAHDVVITTYPERLISLFETNPVVQKDLAVALPPPKRGRRSNADYRLGDRVRSPLVMVKWWRVIMDEVQLCGDSSAASEMVTLIPRKLSLAVSGTPAKSDIKDTIGSLRFLRVPTLPYDTRLWYRLQRPGNRAAFEGVFRGLTVRTTKKEVAGEFNLPSQSRFVVPIDLSEIELHYYNDTLDRQRTLLGLHSRALGLDWELDRQLFQSALKTLRQICTHIQVGAAQERHGMRGERLHLGRALMTLGEALDKIRSDHATTFLVESRLQMRAQIKKAQLLLADEQDDLRHMKALNLYQRVRADIERLLPTVRDQLQKLLGSREGESVDGSEQDAAMSQAERERALAITTTRGHIRELTIILHQTWFFEGDIRHQLNEEDAEVAAYERAEILRRELLAPSLEQAEMSIARLETALKKTVAIESIDEMQTAATNNQGGIRSNSTAQQTNDLLKIMNDNSLLVYNWREKIIVLLKTPVEADGEDIKPGLNTDILDPDAEYYAEALKAQGDVEAYMIAYAAAIADRKEFLLEERSLLATHDSRVTKQRKTQRAQDALKDAPAEVIIREGVHDVAAVLMAERQALRIAREDNHCPRPLKAYLMDLNSISFSESSSSMEGVVAKKLARELKQYIAEQSDIVDKLNKELEFFRSTFNKRVLYFAALQEISDSVSFPEFKDLQAEIAKVSAQIDVNEAILTRMIVRGRYLQYLGKTDDGKEVDVKEECIICFGTSEDTHATLLACGHVFCVSCYRGFRQSMHGRTCPVCKTTIDDRRSTRIKMISDAVAGPADSLMTSASDPIPDAETSDDQEDEAIEESRRAEELRKLRVMSAESLRRISELDMVGEFGSKINTLIKHLLHYKRHQPDVRHVIFSNWRDSIDIVVRALKTNYISFTAFGLATEKEKDVVDHFHKNKDISVFLLHAEKESSGLTLTSCSVVHLLEPVLKHSFELQAIGRVDRLGQTKPTTVFCYSTMDTVESRILAQGVRNHTSIYLEDKDGDRVVAELPNVASAAHKGGDLNDNDDDALLKLIL